MKKRITKYLNGYMKEFDGGMPAPSGGDCWGCYFIDSKGATVMGDDHLIDHFNEKYYVPSLAYNAVREAGYRYPELILGIVPGDEPDEYWMGSGNGYPDMVRRALRKYLVKRLVKQGVTV